MRTTVVARVPLLSINVGGRATCTECGNRSRRIVTMGIKSPPFTEPNEAVAKLCRSCVANQIKCLTDLLIQIPEEETTTI